METPVTPLHVRSGYSLLEGTALPERLVELAGRLGHGHLALTDVNNLCAAPIFDKAAREAGIRPLIGAELRDECHAAVALVADRAGYENLCRIITRRHCRDGSRLLDDLAELSGGLHVIVEDAALAASLVSAGVGPGRLWLGLDPPVQGVSAARRMAECAERTGLGLVATGKAMLAEQGDREVARLLTAIRLGSNYDALEAGQLPPEGALLRAPGALAESLARFPEAVANNRRLVEQCAGFELLSGRPVFPGYRCPEGLSAAAYLRRLCEAGMPGRYGQAPPENVRPRLDHELGLIERLGFSEYFLVVWDIVRYARRHDAPVAGRGSGASSLVAYLLGITNVCPLAYDIPFERFLHEGREDFPDLDVDFCWRIRDDVIDYVFRRWGRDRVAMICTHNTFQPRSAARETAKALGLSNDQISRIAREEPTGGEGDGLSGGGLDQATSRRILRLSRRIVSLPHNLSVHPGGIVITPRAIDRYVPIQPAAKGVMITQFDKDGVEDAHLVKLDLLGNRNLSTVREACDLIGRRHGLRVEVDSIPPSDPATIALLRAAETVGCNQIESPAMRHLLLGLQPAGTRDVMKALALIRPGAASIGMKEVFVRRHRGLDPVPPSHPGVDAVLVDTYGVMLYEDDVMLVAAALAGSDLAEADRFRKAVQKCRDDPQRIDLSRRFLDRCRANGVDADYAKSIWVQMAKFNAYSFCRAHAASYALLAYAAAYLKAHYPLEYWTAALNNNQGMWHPRVYVEQAKRAGVGFLLPDANRSGEEFSIEDGAIRVGLNFIAGLGPAGIAAILEARGRRPFDGLTDCLARARVGQEEARAMILCGAFDFTARTRPELMMELDLFFACRSASQGGGALLSAAPTVPRIADYPRPRKYADERRLLGISVREHIMSLFRPRLAGRTDADSRDLPGRVGRRVKIAGVVEAYRTAPTRTGQTMTFLTLDDEWGLFEITVFPDARRRARLNLNRYGPYLAEGRVEEQYDSVTVTADRVSLVRESRE